MESQNNTIDITDLVNKMRLTFVSLETETIFQALASVQGFQWLRAPLISNLIRKFIEIIINELSKRPVMMAFFGNTAIRKSSQANDYIEAVNRKENASDEEYEKAELDEIKAFNDFVRVTS